MSKSIRIVVGLVAVILLMAAFWIITPNMPHVLAGNTTPESATTLEPQSAATGEWNASVKQDSSKIHLNLERRSERGGRNQTGQSYDFAELQGLTREQALSSGPVRFSLVREAGRIDFEGSFQNGKGSGSFNFTSNPNFVSAMKNRGFDFEARSIKRHNKRNNDANAEKRDADAARDANNDRDHADHIEDRLFAATTLNVTTALADDLSGAFGKLTVDDLFKAAIFKIDSTFAREMKASGFENLGMEELVKARIFKIDAAFVRQVSQMGFEKEPFESLVKMQIFKVTPEFIAEVRGEGFTNIQVEDIVKFRIFKIDGQFIREAKADGVPLQVERLVQRKIGVSRR